MYFELNDILAALAGGQSADDLANNFSEVLNKALAERKRLEEEEREKQRKETEQKTKVKHAAIMINEVADFLEKYYPEIFTATIVASMRQDSTAKEVVKMMDETRDEVLQLRPAIESLFPKDLINSIGNKKKEPTKEKTDPISDFLKSYNLF